ncbi:hypothetical protein HYW39_00450, partial [Candidatus Curtissbacteria bacterium]|nr:hypothetical protein [Candidatus Curtissbacteria bacterium]
MKNTIGSKRLFLACLQITAACLAVLSLVTAGNQDVFAEPKSADLVEDMPDNNPSQHPSGKDRNLEHGKSQT